MRDGDLVDAEIRQPLDDRVGDAGVAVDLHVIDVRVGERLHLRGHLVGRGLLVGREGRVREEQLALELAEEERLGEADIRAGDQFFDLLALFGDLLGRESHFANPRRTETRRRSGVTSVFYPHGPPHRKPNLAPSSA